VKSNTIADAVLPGAGLVVDGHPARGLPLLVPAVVVLSAIIFALVFGGFAGSWILPRALPLYLVLAIAAVACRWRFERRARLDPAETHRLARAASQAWLRGDANAAQQAQALVRAAPELAQAWRLHAVVTGDRRSVQRAENIERR